MTGFLKAQALKQPMPGSAVRFRGWRNFASRRARSLWLRLVVRRLVASVPVLIGVSLLTFFVTELLPGNVAQQLAGAEASAEQVARLEAELGLDRPAWIRYRDWLTGVLKGDFGQSLVSNQSVSALLAERLPVTVLLVVYAFVLSIALAVPLALMSARWPDGFLDRIAAAVGMAGISVANYVLALVLILVFAVHLRMLPAFGFVPPMEGLASHVRSLTLPAVAIALPLLCFYARFLRGDLMEQLQGQEYIVAAKARGLGPWRVVAGHALPNSLFGLLTLVGLNFGSLIGGTVIIEQIFALPGLGQLLLQSIATRDIIVVQAIVLVLTVVTVAANLIVDMLYAVLDPRVRYGC